MVVFCLSSYSRETRFLQASSPFTYSLGWGRRPPRSVSYKKKTALVGAVQLKAIFPGFTPLCLSLADCATAYGTKFKTLYQLCNTFLDLY